MTNHVSRQIILIFFPLFVLPILRWSWSGRQRNGGSFFTCALGWTVKRRTVRNRPPGMLTVTQETLSPSQFSRLSYQCNLERGCFCHLLDGVPGM